MHKTLCYVCHEGRCNVWRTSMDNLVKAYLAGVVDGEGTITLSRSHANQTPSPEVSIVNTYYPLITWIRARVGKGIIRQRTGRRVQHATSYIWTVRSDAAIAFLRQIQPWLIIKKQHARLIVSQYKKVTCRNGRYPQALLQRKLRLVRKIRELNAR